MADGGRGERSVEKQKKERERETERGGGLTFILVRKRQREIRTHIRTLGRKEEKQHPR